MARLSVRAVSLHRLGEARHKADRYSGRCSCGYKGPWRDQRTQANDDVKLHWRNDLAHWKDPPHHWTNPSPFVSESGTAFGHVGQNSVVRVNHVVYVIRSSSVDPGLDFWTSPGTISWMRGGTPPTLELAFKVHGDQLALLV